ncbi:DNA-protecting protein DprA [Chryseobacterium sp. SNU WT5]|uniref:DNA-processing protein DprA n=1 Tax=Chryseobacterium sp. SNU WT5 TaxID=2594269 RepID=UPI001181229C|nr:DNA-processing protein DprA [Chryseobacterium sp. SNU WT5]QDP85170.1 DNA-protecting protein DprA [Chryseobacterium sp. SNU WT5]
MRSEETFYSIALRHCPLIGDVVFRKLVGEVGSAKEVWELSKTGLQNIFGIGKKIALEIGDPKHLKFAENEIEFCKKNNIVINLRHFGDLPILLNECEDAPAILYQKGKFDSLKKPISIVGTRNISLYGKQFIHNFIDGIKGGNAITVSGLALGVDAEVHEVSLDHHLATAAVLAHGFHTLYPSKHRKLSERILSNGGVLFTEFNSSQKPDRENFIQRNRIIAGLAPATIVVETAFSGGSISTATFANNYNREVYALPGRIDEKYSQGCNQLIYQNKAAVISTIPNLIDQLGFNNKSEKIGELFPNNEIRILLSDSQQKIIDQLDKRIPLSLDDISLKLEIPSYKILPDLLQLEISGYIRALSGRQYLAL